MNSATLLEWIANATPEDQRPIRREIKRSYYDRGDKLGYEALNAALSDILQPGMNREVRQDILNGIEPYAHTEAARGQSSELLTAASLLLLGMVPFGAATETASAAWSLGWAARGLYFSERLGANLPFRFPVIDSFVNGLASSIKSIDLRAATYQNALRLTSKLDGYVNRLLEYEGSVFGDIKITSGDIASRRLSLAIPKGSMTSTQRTVIDAARRRAESLGIDLIVTEF
jgi:hypothetical protein